MEKSRGFARLSSHLARLPSRPKRRATNTWRCYNGRVDNFVAISHSMPIRHAQAADLPAIVDIYNASIPGRMATADTVAGDRRRAGRLVPGVLARPAAAVGARRRRGPRRAGCRCARSTAGRPTTRRSRWPSTSTRGGSGGASRGGCSTTRSPPRRRCGIRTLLAFVFAHNHPSLTLFEPRRLRRLGPAAARGRTRRRRARPRAARPAARRMTAPRAGDPRRHRGRTSRRSMR